MNAISMALVVAIAASIVALLLVAYKAINAPSTYRTQVTLIVTTGEHEALLVKEARLAQMRKEDAEAEMKASYELRLCAQEVELLRAKAQWTPEDNRRAQTLADLFQVDFVALFNDGAEFDAKDIDRWMAKRA